MNQFRWRNFVGLDRNTVIIIWFVPFRISHRKKPDYRRINCTCQMHHATVGANEQFGIGYHCPYFTDAFAEKRRCFVIDLRVIMRRQYFDNVIIWKLDQQILVKRHPPRFWIAFFARSVRKNTYRFFLNFLPNGVKCLFLAIFQKY